MQGLPPAVQLIGIGWFVALSVILGVAGGVFLDRAVDSEPIFTLAGLALGLLMAFWGGYVQLRNVLTEISSQQRGKQ
ncbi:MAG TPA: AtpZ/AtpI family protein [Dehalococcoidia bacterium]|jgi:F0F1-type ATP synthase assembly protein I|nr:AtpZ/AtpI family protein [Dehalococcoidia bacterium]